MHFLGFLEMVEMVEENNKYEKRTLRYDNKDAKRPSNYYNTEN